jgi:hypothetical protein
MFETEDDAAASDQLAAAIGSLTQLIRLQLHSLPRHLDVGHCCSHLIGLLSLQNLTLRTLAVTPEAEDAAAVIHSVTEGCFVSLLAGMTALDTLELIDLQMSRNDALAFSTTAVTRLTSLTGLSLRDNYLSTTAFFVLAATARGLPSLSTVEVAQQYMSTGTLESTCSGLNFVRGRPIFQ